MNHDPALRLAIGDPIEDVYAAIDRGLGVLLDEAGPETTVLVLASHGMGPHYDATFLLPEILQRIQARSSPYWRRKSGRLLANAWDLLPQAARQRLTGPGGRANEPVPDELPANALRRCFPVLNNDAYGAVRLNLKGREPYGRLQPGDEAERYCRKLTRALLSLVRIEDGARAVKSVLRTDQLFRGEHLSDLPDLLVEWNRSAPIRGVESRATGRIEGRFKGTRTGDHKEAGMWIAAGPGIRAGEVTESVSVMDFAPTIGALLGVPLPHLDGRAIPRLAASREMASASP